MVLGYRETFEVALGSFEEPIALMVIGLFCLVECDICCEKCVVVERVASE